MNWEYKVFTFIPKVNELKIPDVDGSLENVLNKYGSSGWELVSTLAKEPKNDYIKLVFKRPKE